MKADALLSHLEKYLGAFSEKIDFSNEAGINLQILIFPQLFEDGSCGYSTYGAGNLIYHFKGAHRRELEIVALMKSRYDEIAAALAMAAFFIAENKEPVRPGYCTDPFLRINTPSMKPFVSLYFSTPAVFDRSFWKVTTEEAEIHFLIAFPIFHSERDYIKREGSEKFENLLSDKGVDFMDWERDPLFDDIKDYARSVQ